MICPSCQAENDPTSEVCFTCGKPLAALTLGSLIASRYEIVKILGKGGMGMVYQAFDRMLEEDVAIKVLRRDLTGTPEMAQRFRSEIKLARRISHPNVCRIHEYGEDGGLSYISMALLEGRDVAELVDEHPQGLPREEALEIAIQVARGLQAIHDEGVIHRDLKTPNIMRDAKGVVRLMDFGIAKESGRGGSGKLTATGMVMGTPEYMSPEQCRGEKLDFRSDVYGLGIVIFELFTGEVPFRGDSLMATLFKHVQEKPPLDGPLAGRIPRGVIPILEKALAKQLDARYATAGELVQALEKVRADPAALEPPKVEPPPAEPVEATSVVAPPVERRRSTRLEIPLNVKLKRMSGGGSVLKEELTIIDNMSRRGARVMTAMTEIVEGDMVGLQEMGGDFETKATVRNTYVGKDHIHRLGLEFLDGQAPDRLVHTGDIKSTLAQGVRAAPAAKTPPPRPARTTPAPALPDEDRRVSARLEIPLDVHLKRLGQGDAPLQEERTIAENISRGGARVLTGMSSVAKGEVVEFEEHGSDFKTRATVRNSYSGSDRIHRLNLKFLDRKAPDRLVPPDDMTKAKASFAAVSRAVPKVPTAQAKAIGALQREQVVDLFAGLKTRNHFEVLGIPRASKAEQVKEAYFKLAKVFHPDAAKDPGLEDLKSEINAIFVRLDEAHQVLSNPMRRGSYESSLGPSRERSFPTASSVSSGTGASPRVTPPGTGPSPAVSQPLRRSPEEEAALVQHAIAEGKKFLDEQKYWDAIQVLEHALPLAEADRRQRHRVEVLLAQAVVKNPKWKKRAEELLQTVVKQDPKNVDAHLQLGLLYKEGGLKSRSERMLRRVLELDPTNKQANAALGDTDPS